MLFRSAAEQIWFGVKDDFPAQWDWTLQDGGAEFARWLQSGDAAGVEREVEQQNIDAMLGIREPARGRGPGGPMMPRRY